MSLPERRIPDIYKNGKEKERKPARFRNATATVVALGAVYGVPSSMAQEQPECDTPTSRQMQAVDNLWENSENFMLKRAVPVTAGYSESSVAIAKKHGLTTYDTQPIVDHLYRDFERGNPAKFDAYFATAKEFLERYGVELVLGQEGKEGNYEIAKLDEKQLETPESKIAMAMLIQDFGRLPVEFVKSTGLQQIKLVNFSAADGLAGLAVEENKMFYLDPTVNLEQVSLHELTHIWDAQQCGESSEAMDNDPAYKALNPGDIYSKPTEFFSIFSYVDAKYRMRMADLNNDQHIVRQMRSELDQMSGKIVVMEDYGFKNVVEDKATVGEQVFTPSAYDYINGKPILENKMKLLLGRIYNDGKVGRNTVKYLVDISRPSKSK